MANIQERRNKDGKLISYSIRVHRGRGSDGKQLKPWITTFEVSPTWTEKSARKKAEAFAAIFEKECRQGITSDSRQTFQPYCDYVLELKESRGTKHSTIVRYRELTARIYPTIGHIKLKDLRADHLNTLYTELGKEGSGAGSLRAITKPVVDGDAGQGLSDDPDAPPTEPPIEGLEGGQANEGGSSPERLVPEIPPEIPEAGSVAPPFWVGPEEPALEPPPVEEHPLGGETAAVAGEPDPAPAPPRSDRQNFFALDFNELDRELTQEERQEWNSIYASYRGRSALTGTIIGVDPLHIVVRNKDTGAMERQTMYCAIVVPYRVRIVIPAAEMWERAQTRPDFVLQNMVGASIEFIIIKVDRENKIAIGSRRLASRSQRHFFANRLTLNQAGSKIKCQVLSVGPRRCLVGCYGHDVNLTQRELSYTAIPDLRRKYHPGMELDCVVKDYDPRAGTLRISVKEMESNPFDGAEQRHPVGARRQAVIAGKYGGGVFCNLPDGTVCMCNYSYQHEDADFMVGDTVILVVQRFEGDKRQMYGKILSKW